MVKVLIIEDDSSARLVTKLHLRNEYQVVEASDGMEAMELLKHQSVDLIIADVMSALLLGGTLVFGDRPATTELKRRFHV